MIPSMFRKGFKFDFEADEWYHICGACGTEICTPTLKDLRHNFNVHTHSKDCLGGW